LSKNLEKSVTVSIKILSSIISVFNRY